MRVRVNSGVYRYPDVVVVCGGEQFADEREDTLLNPTVIVEVLSPSTEAYDHGAKFAEYRTMPSLREYLLLSTDWVQAELFTRQEDRNWLLTVVDRPDGAVELRSVDCRLSMAELYRDVE